MRRMIMAMAGVTAFTLSLPACSAAVERVSDPSASAASATPSTSAVVLSQASVRLYMTRSGDISFSDRAAVDELLDTVTGTQRATEEDLVAQFASDGWRVDGVPVLTYVGEAKPVADSTDMTMAICVDTTKVHYYDGTGTERRAEGATNLTPMTAVSARGPDGVWRVSDLSYREDPPSCPS